jgi:hypothetical protein
MSLTESVIKFRYQIGGNEFNKETTEYDMFDISLTWSFFFILFNLL